MLCQNGYAVLFLLKWDYDCDHLNPEKQTMSIATVREDQTPYQPLGVLPLTLRVLESFEEFVRLNPDLVVEQNSNGEI